MTSNARKLAKILWGSSFANEIRFGTPLDDWMAYTKPRDGSISIVTEAGVVDAWVFGTEYLLQFHARWIPSTLDVATNTTGWDDSPNGWSLFLISAREMNQFRFYPDRDSSTYYTCTLAEWDQPPSIEPNGQRSQRLTIRNIDSPFIGY